MAATEGSVLALISKRLRTHRKKQNRIAEMEESLSQGKTLNKDQEEILRSKPIINALIEELLKLRLPPPPPTTTADLPKQKARKEKGQEKDVVKTDEVSNNSDEVSNNSDEVSNDNTSTCNGADDVTPATTSKPRRRRNKSKKPAQASERFD
ncbi:hypothetical protein AALP_AA3G034300 [Arabis alpina]|uniref:Uncharacterized protein n=1 Tax=Arabis alpina TaxID=50452 RepID=A0A087H6S4_ARAAL|nr:hypothetical protein AALP_AA3G034300 [Arabis alpina]